MEIAVNGRYIRFCYCVKEAINGSRGLSLVAVGAAEEIVGADLLIAGAVAVEEVGGLKQEGVGGQLGVGTVERVGLVEEGEHLAPLTVVAGGQERQENYDREKPLHATTLFHNLNTTGMQTFVRQGWPSMMPAVHRGIMRNTRSTSWSHWRLNDVTMATSVMEPSLLTMNSATTRP